MVKPTVAPALTLAIRLCAAHPATGAKALEQLDPGACLEILEALNPSQLARLLPHLNTTHLSALVRNCESERIAPILEKGGPEVCASVLIALEVGSRETFLRSLPKELTEKLREYLEFPESSVGRVMKTDYAAFERTLSVGEVIASMRRRPRGRQALSNVFVVDEDHHLVGVVSLRDLLVADDDASLESLTLREILTAHAFDDVSVASQTLAGRGFTSLPVVDSQGRLIGVVRSAQLIGEAQEVASQDLQKIFGVGREERAFSRLSFCLRKRLPWLHVNLLTAFLAASVVAAFEDVIARITILAVFLPVVAGQGGNAGAQSLAVVMRGLIMKEIPANRVRALLLKESLIGLVNGLVVGTITAFIAVAWNGNPYLGVVIGLAMIVNLTAAGFAGAAVPLGMKKLGLDPAQSSSIMLTTVTDVVGFCAFLGCAVLFEDQLM
jgi:magnesium transporter